MKFDQLFIFPFVRIKLGEKTLIWERTVFYLSHLTFHFSVLLQPHTIPRGYARPAKHTEYFYINPMSIETDSIHNTGVNGTLSIITAGSGKDETSSNLLSMPLNLDTCLCPSPQALLRHFPSS